MIELEITDFLDAEAEQPEEVKPPADIPSWEDKDLPGPLRVYA